MNAGAVSVEIGDRVMRLNVGRNRCGQLGAFGQRWQNQPRGAPYVRMTRGDRRGQAAGASSARLHGSASAICRVMARPRVGMSTRGQRQSHDDCHGPRCCQADRAEARRAAASVGRDRAAMRGVRKANRPHFLIHFLKPPPGARRAKANRPHFLLHFLKPLAGARRTKRAVRDGSRATKAKVHSHRPLSSGFAANQW